MGSDKLLICSSSSILVVDGLLHELFEGVVAQREAPFYFPSFLFAGCAKREAYGIVRAAVHAAYFVSKNDRKFLVSYRAYVIQDIFLTINSEYENFIRFNSWSELIY